MDHTSTSKFTIAGIETMAERFGLEENLGVVKVGGDASVVQDLTNDYGAVRDAIGRMHDRCLFVV